MYFWIMIIISVFAAFGYGMIPRWTARDFFDIAYCIISMIGLYAYVYQKSFYTKTFWRGVFLASIFIAIFDLVYMYSDAFTLPSYFLSANYTEDMKSWYIPALLFSLPFYYALHQLGYGSPKTAKPHKKSKK